MAVSNEKTAAQIAAQEVIREYGLHLLAKLRVYWLNAYGSNTQVRSAYPKGPYSLVAAIEGLQKPTGQMLISHALLDIYNEA
jgi:hypothetical protein